MLQPQQIEEHTARILRDGYTIIENAIEPELLDGLIADLGQLEVNREPAYNFFEGFKTLRVYNLLAKGPRFERVPVHEHVLPVIERVLDEGCLVSSLSSATLLPGEVAQPIHADDFLIPLPKPHVPILCNTIWALTDFTEENGATRIIPGSHLADRSPKLDEKHAHTIPAEMKRGSVLVIHGSVWHGGGANRSQDARVGLLMNYCAGYIRQQENQQLGIPRDIVERFSPRLRALVGYGIYHNVIGHIDRFNPVEVFQQSVRGKALRRLLDE